MRALVLGHGYSAGFLTPLLLERGWQVTGTTRDAPQRVAASGATPLLWPGAEDQVRAEIARADAILICAAPGRESDPVLADFAGDLARARPRWLGYLSTTGVYGDHAGGWVDEDTPLTPSTPRGQERVAAETAWRALADAHDLPLHVFRLAGIYGPGRGPFAKVRAGTARRIVKPGQVFSRIHVADIAQVLMASIQKPRPGAVYNVCDDDPAPPEDVIAHAAHLLDLPLPKAEDYATAPMTPMARSFYAESKRVSNARIKEELGVRLLYPDYRSGLQAMMAAEPM
ncbi:SDR family oxidoreductase [Paracoccus laeviglucosivorans]|uniref:Nucleoside-diphosphate-sugar epimerase n=1 Tax=Paracoccus laeviglucosivorans TaxID=1197861 RepID=A0A521AWT2_9RHOB|nr:SDR family oxidoreductase [Paracoccus laeviglucosivorans]SMO39171.1 Nucleoside-diphosphate-sugar epimerase [Paracoccus laeviglucosivorans]